MRKRIRNTMIIYSLDDEYNVFFKRHFRRRVNEKFSVISSMKPFIIIIFFFFSFPSEEDDRN